MTRSQQKKLRELKQYLPKLLKSLSKQFGLKKTDYMIWQKSKDVFFSLLISVGENDGRCFCSTSETIKPLWIDDLFWDIMDMPENKSEPMSLRSIGAFTVYGAEVYEDITELQDWSKEELEECISKYFEHFRGTVNTCTEKSYYEMFDPSAYHGDIQSVLILMHQEKYEEALEQIKILKTDSFSNKGLTFGEYAERYCKEHLV